MCGISRVSEWGKNTENVYNDGDPFDLRRPGANPVAGPSGSHHPTYRQIGAVFESKPRNSPDDG